MCLLVEEEVDSKLEKEVKRFPKPKVKGVLINVRLNKNAVYDLRRLRKYLNNRKLFMRHYRNYLNKLFEFEKRW